MRGEEEVAIDSPTERIEVKAMRTMGGGSTWRQRDARRRGAPPHHKQTCIAGVPTTNSTGRMACKRSAVDRLCDHGPSGFSIFHTSTVKQAYNTFTLRYAAPCTAACCVAPCRVACASINSEWYVRPLLPCDPKVNILLTTAAASVLYLHACSYVAAAACTHMHPCLST